MLGKLNKYYIRAYYRWLKGKRGFWRVKRELTELLLRDRIEDFETDPITELEWDNLIILDAARHDLYEEVNGETDSRITVGSQSTEYIEKTFSEGDFSDTVYITANPFFNEKKFEEITGRKLEDVFHEVFHTYMEDWNEEENTVMPESLVRDAKTAEKLFPDKKKIIHFMQPHYPFIGSDFSSKGLNPDLGREERELSLWQRAELGEYDREELWDAYRENLEFVMPAAEELAGELEGRTAITADHGNLVGEQGTYGHPRGLKVKELRKVPWDVREDE
jgi:hypothetical protein